MKYHIDGKGLALTDTAEGFKEESYQDPKGIWTIGYGSTTLNGYPVSAGMVINEPVAMALLMGSFNDILTLLEKAIFVNLNQNQVDALCAFVYNVGKRAFIGSSLLNAINKGLIITEDLFTRWDKIRLNNGELVVLDGLINRRKKEYNLYMSKDGL